MEIEEEFQEEIIEKGNESKEIEPLYDGELEPNDVTRRPILKPVANINNSFMDSQRLLNKSLFDYKRVKHKIDEMLLSMPKYSQTVIVSELLKLVNCIEQFIFLADHQQETLKRTINEMIQVSEEEPEE